MIFKKLALVAALGLVVTAAQAETFNYSYNLGNGSVVTGSFDGTASGNLVTNLSNISAAIDGVAFNNSGNLFGSSYNSSAGGWVSGGAVASFSGLENNFLFINSDYPNNYNYSNYFYSITYYSQAYAYNANSGQSGGGSFNASQWALTSAVPEPETYAMMLGGLAMLAALARRRKAAQA
jgi:PEP-CTERM motif